VLAGWRAVHHTPLIYVTHARDEVAAFADQAALLLDGRVVAVGEPSSVLLS
jgi:ABC-type molybdate transport system ATPase subunit